jgi:N-acyl-D-amino-acid deacylase
MKNIVYLIFILPLLSQGQSFDLLIVNGKIVDGTGNSWYYGDIAIKEGKIVKVGKVQD